MGLWWMLNTYSSHALDGVVTLKTGMLVKHATGRPNRNGIQKDALWHRSPGQSRQANYMQEYVVLFQTDTFGINLRHFRQ
jgi:hypothetical protein